MCFILKIKAYFLADKNKFLEFSTRPSVGLLYKKLDPTRPDLTRGHLKWKYAVSGQGR